MKKILPIIIGLVIFSSLILASNCPPSIPKTYYGEVSYDRNLLIGNYEVRAVMGSDTVGITDVSSGNYLIDVSPCYGSTGEITFYINGVEANEKGSYDGMDDWGKSENLNLTVDVLPPTTTTCNDEVIQSGEECDGTNLAGRSVNDCGAGWTGTISCSSTCEIDYSNCVLSAPAPLTPSASGGGSSGGGGGSSGGGSSGGSSPPIILNSETGEADDALNLNFETGEKNKIELNNNVSLKKTSPGITGAVIGFAKTGKGIGIIFVVLIFIAGISSIIVSKNKSKREE